MRSFAEWLFFADKDSFAMIRSALSSRFMEDNAVVFANINAWMPFFVFLAILLYLSKPNAAVFSIFFGLATFILSFQAAALLANYLMQPAPWKVEYWLHGTEIPAFGNGNEISLPDWPIAAMVGSYYYVRLRMKLWGESKITWAWIPILIFSILRIYAGYTYPLGVIFAIFTGILMGWLIFQLARNVELLSPPPAAEPESPSKGDTFED